MCVILLTSFFVLFVFLNNSVLCTKLNSWKFIKSKYRLIKCRPEYWILIVINVKDISIKHQYFVVCILSSIRFEKLKELVVVFSSLLGWNENRTNQWSERSTVRNRKHCLKRIFPTSNYSILHCFSTEVSYQITRRAKQLFVWIEY